MDIIYIYMSLRHECVIFHNSLFLVAFSTLVSVSFTGSDLDLIISSSYYIFICAWYYLLIFWYVVYSMCRFTPRESWRE